MERSVRHNDGARPERYQQRRRSTSRAVQLRTELPGLAFRLAIRKREDRDSLVVRDVRTGRRHEVEDPQMTDPEMDAVRDEVFRVLGWE